LNETDPNQFKKLGTAYLRARKKLFARLSPDDHKYFSFQLWLEGIACYTEIKTAEAATNYQPAAAYLRLPDYQSFAAYSLRARADTVDELKQADLAKEDACFRVFLRRSGRIAS
jgi:hypothetical protein